MSSSNGESTDTDDEFNEDMEALRRACQLIGETPTAGGPASNGSLSDGESDSDGDDDLQLVQSIQKRFAVPIDSGEEPLIMKPLCTLIPDWSDNDDIEDDYATLRAIQRRFAAYNDGICCPLFPLIELTRFSKFIYVKSVFNRVEWRFDCCEFVLGYNVRELLVCI